MYKLNKYPKYKPSGITWLGYVPEGWKLRKIKYSFTERVEKGFPDEPLLAATQSKGVVPKSHYENRTVLVQKDFHLLKLVKINDFVISLRSFQGGIERAFFQGIISPAYTIMVPDKIINPNFFKYLGKSISFISLLKTSVTGIREGQNIDYNLLKRQYLALPDSSEQSQIARFLDWKVNQINKFIKAKKRIIDLLKEQKQAIINDAVTGKIDVRTGKPYPKYRPSGVEWLGDIPEEWNILKLRNILSPFSKKNRSDLPLLSVVREKGIILRNSMSVEENHNFIPDDLQGYKVVEEGQFAMNKMKAWQGSYGISHYNGIVSPAYFVFKVNFENLNFFHIAIRCKCYIKFFGQASDGIRIGQWDLSLQRMKEIPFLVPPQDIQKIIVDKIPEKFRSIENTIIQIEKELILIQEYKIRLIADVVTGKADVRDIEVPEVIEDEIDIPEEIKEEEIIEMEEEE